VRILHHQPMPQVPYRPAGPLTPGRRRLLAALGGVTVLGLAGAIVWAQTHTGDYGPSRDGCVNVLVPSTMGGGVIHRCGDEALAWCRAEYAADDRMARLVQPECRRAGITPQPTAATR
jgi:hypothetical protein